MGFIIGLLMLVMVLDCIVLILLVLIQLPKKDAGAGLAFGSGATDALFGAGSGNALTKITKYAAIAFFGLTIVISVMQSNYHSRRSANFLRGLNTPLASPTPDMSAASRSANPTPANANQSASSTNLPADLTNYVFITSNGPVAQPLEATNAPGTLATNVVSPASNSAPAPAPK